MIIECMLQSFITKKLPEITAHPMGRNSKRNTTDGCKLIHDFAIFILAAEQL
jgi:hypothetical protein